MRFTSNFTGFRGSRSTTLKFIVIAIIFMVVLDWLVFGDKSRHLDWAQDSYQQEQAARLDQAQEFRKIIDGASAPQHDTPPDLVEPESGQAYFEATELPPPPPWKTNAVPVALKPGVPKIAIIIDDVGMNLTYSRQSIELPGPVTLAFLPYAEKTPALATEAKANGHELLIHTPMEPMDPDIDIGSMGLRSDMDDVTFDREFEKISKSFDGYVGINNHMGSRLTQNERVMSRLMTNLRSRGLLFVDSRTINTSVAADMARAAGIPFAIRDVFLDHEDTADFVADALAEVERVAREHGQAIAIGHPKRVTMEGLQAWIPTLEEKGFQLVPVSAVVTIPSSARVSAAQ